MILEAIHKINPNAECIVKNGNLDDIEWLNGTTPIAKADIEAKLSEVQAEEDAKIEKLKTNKANAKAKLISGDPLTEEEADTIVL